MGICLSSPKNKKTKNKNKNNSKNANVQESNTPPLLEEETVKEVLLLASSKSKTPTSTTDTSNKLQDLKFSILKQQQQQNMLKTNKTRTKNMSEATSDVSSSLTESVSTLCTSTRDDGEHIRHVVRKSPARHRSFSGDFGTKRDQNGGPVRFVRSRESGRVDPGERSERWCKSPVVRVGGGYATRADLGRSFSCRRTGGSPSHCRVNGSDRMNKKLTESLSTKELLDNPVVSLECFIFL